MKEEESEITRKHGNFSDTPVENFLLKRATGAKEKAIGNYRLLQHLGSGEFGEVYKAIRVDLPGSEECYAIKVLKNHYDRKDYLRLIQEARILKKLSHQSLPRFIETGISRSDDVIANTPYLVMEFVQGETLKIARGKGPISPDTLLRWVYEIAQAVCYLHRQEVVHCDLKPSNIQVVWSRQHGRSIKILDFGIAVLRRHSNQDREIIGTMRYMSPEQFVGKKVGKAADIYAMGIILYEMLNDSYPYVIADAVGFEQWRDIHRSAQPQPISNRIVPFNLAQAILRCLEKDQRLRPDAESLLAIIEKEVAGIGIPSYIGILGARGCGKTCYLTSLYSDVEVSPETKKVLESKYLNLYEKGEVPSATALSAYRLNLRITTEQRCYDIVTKDYGGELLAGRSNDDLDADMQEKRDEVYEFFQSARAVLILVETLPAQNSLAHIIDYRNEIYSLLEKIAITREGVRKVGVPIALVLTKWDRSGDISWKPEKETERALRYIANTGWLHQLYNKLKILCPHLSVFPVFSFIGDKPNSTNIRPFNLCAPLIWSSDKGDLCLWEKCSRYHQEHPQDSSTIIESYWRLLHVEKINDPKIRRQAEVVLQDLSKRYWQEVQTNVKKEHSQPRWCIGQYQQFLATKGIGAKEQQQARHCLEQLRQRYTTRRCRLAIIAAVLLLVLAYAGWEVIADISIRQALIKFEQGQLEPQQFLPQVHAYRQYKPIGILRWWRAAYVSNRVKQALQNRLEKESGAYRHLLKEELAVAPVGSEVFGREDAVMLAEKLADTKQKISKYDGHIQKVHWLQDLQNRWVSYFKIEVSPSFTSMATESKLQQLQQQRLGWIAYCTFLEKMQRAFVEKERLTQECTALLQQNYSLQPAPQSQRWPEQWQQGQKLLEQLQSKHDELQNYLQLYPRSPFRGDMLLLKSRITTNLSEYRQSFTRIARLYKLQQRYLKLLPALTRSSQFTPDGKDSALVLNNKKQEIGKLRALCRQIIEFLQQSQADLPTQVAQKWLHTCEKALAPLNDYYQRCALLLALRRLESLAQSGRVSVNEADTPATLAVKITSIRNCLKQIQKYQPAEKLGSTNAVELLQAQTKYSASLESVLGKLIALRELLQSLEQKCRHYCQEWRQSIQNAHSYSTTVYEIETLAKNIGQCGYLRQYQRQLRELLAQIKEMRRLDRIDYLAIEEKIREHEFFKAEELVICYLMNPKHLQIMGPDLVDYIQRFRCKITVAVHINHKEFREEANPDFRLIVSEYTIRRIGFWMDKHSQGVLLLFVWPGSLAATSGLRPGDIIVRCGGKNVEAPEQLIKIINVFKPEQTVPFQVLRAGNYCNLEMALTAQHQAQAKPQKPWTLSKDDIASEEVEMGQITTELGFMDVYIWGIEVREQDVFLTDYYQTTYRRLGQLLANKKISYTHDCGRDGKVAIKLVPAQIEPQVDLPKYKN